VKIHALTTGAVRVKHSFLFAGSGVRRQPDLFLPGDFSDPLPIHCWAIEHDGVLRLVDTGETAAARDVPFARMEVTPEQELPSAMAVAGLNLDDVAEVVLTHAHGDHVGSLDALAAALPQAEVSISARDARFLAGDMSLDADEPQSKLRGGYPKVKTRPGRLLAPGDRVGSLEVVAAPGHTPGQVAFLDTRDRTLIAADAFSTLGGVATSAKPNPRFPLPGLATWDRPTALRTAKELRALDPARLAVGHGNVAVSPGAAMDAAIAKLDGR
jgi:glyoxylase-like metal-dependent hydrolase (beta-lactamase superfamily II)